MVIPSRGVGGGPRKSSSVFALLENGNRSCGSLIIHALWDDSTGICATKNVGASQSEISRDERLRGRLPMFGRAAGEVHAANCPESRVPAERGPGKVEVRIENILAMLPSRQAVIDDEREHYVARG
jgi:hypothetical protein